MSKLTVLLILAVVAVAGLARLAAQRVGWKKRRRFAETFLARFKSLAHSDAFDEETYTWLVARSARMQERLGVMGLASAWRRPGVRLPAVAVLFMVVLFTRFPGDFSLWPHLREIIPGARALSSVAKNSTSRRLSGRGGAVDARCSDPVSTGVTSTANSPRASNIWQAFARLSAASRSRTLRSDASMASQS